MQGIVIINLLKINKIQHSATRQNSFCLSLSKPAVLYSSVFKKICVTEVAKLLPDKFNNQHWFVLYTKPRWEKKVATQLNKKGFEVYCPLNKVRRKWSDRYKIIEDPLFKSYVFINFDIEEQTRVRLTDGVVNFVYWQGSPAIIKESEILLIKRFLNEFTDVRVKTIELNPGMKVRVKTGLMMDHEGLVIDVKNNLVSVVLETLGYQLTATFDKKNLELVERLKPCEGN
jgi:transcription antitermination factor NusG